MSVWEMNGKNEGRSRASAPKLPHRQTRCSAGHTIERGRGWGWGWEGIYGSQQSGCSQCGTRGFTPHLFDLLSMPRLCPRCEEPAAKAAQLDAAAAPPNTARNAATPSLNTHVRLPPHPAAQHPFPHTCEAGRSCAAHLLEGKGRPARPHDGLGEALGKLRGSCRCRRRRRLSSCTLGRGFKGRSLRCTLALRSRYKVSQEGADDKWLA